VDYKETHQQAYEQAIKEGKSLNDACRAADAACSEEELIRRGEEADG